MRIRTAADFIIILLEMLEYVILIVILVWKEFSTLLGKVVLHSAPKTQFLAKTAAQKLSEVSIWSEKTAYCLP